MYTLRLLLLSLLFLSTPALASQESNDAELADSESAQQFEAPKSANDREREHQKTRRIEKANPARESKYFNPYILRAVAYLNRNYRLRGYDINKAFTHKLKFGDKNEIQGSTNGTTMCVAAVMETILTAFEIYKKETSDNRVWTYLPFESWATLGDNTIKTYIWVDKASSGTGDGLVKFGMGERPPYAKLTPGSFANLNFTDGTGHSVVFMNWIDKWGFKVKEYDAKKVAGMRFFSAQGEEKKGEGGLGYGLAFFEDRPCMEFLSLFRRVPVFCGTMRSDDQKYLNTGTMYLPEFWQMPPEVSAE